MGALFENTEQVRQKSNFIRKYNRLNGNIHPPPPLLSQPVMRPRPPFPPGRLPPPGIRPMHPPGLRGPMLRGRMIPPRMGGHRGLPPPVMRPGPPNMRPPLGMRPMHPPHMIRPMPPMMRPPNGIMFRPGAPPLLPHNRMRRPILIKGKIMKKKRPMVNIIDLTKPWVTNQIKSEFLKKDELLRNAKMSQAPGDWSLFRDQREKCSNLYNSARLEYIGQYPEDNRIPQLMPSNQTVPIITGPIDYTADVIL